MQWLDTEGAIIDKLHTMLTHSGNPLNHSYLAGYVSLFLNAYKLGGPRSEHIFDVLEGRGAMQDPHAEINLPALCEAWSHWWLLLDEGLGRGLVTLGPRGPYDDFAPKPGLARAAR